MFVYEIEAADLYSVLGRVLDRARVTGLTMSSITAAQTDEGCIVTATIDTADRDIAERMARVFSEMFGVTSVMVGRAAVRRSYTSERTSHVLAAQGELCGG